MMERAKAVVLLSGGMDSCVCAAIAMQKYELAVLHASYGQRTERRELKAFEEIADFFGVCERLAVKLDHFKSIGGSALTDSHIEVPVAQPGSLRVTQSERAGTGNEIPPTYVPFRNAHFLAVAVSWAEVIGASAIFIGAVQQDSSGYPDCRPEYYHVFQQLIREGTRPETEIEIVTPVIGMRKYEIVRRGFELGAPLDRTWSCYQFEDEACGVCDSCRLRLDAFAEAGVADPIAYRGEIRDNADRLSS